MQNIIARLISLIISMCLFSTSAFASSGFSTIRDEEIESYLKEISGKVFRVSGLDPKSVKIYLVNDSELNAFVAGGQNLFLHTGLLMESEDPSMIMGVIAHEAGHIAGGHLVRKGNEMTSAYMGMAMGAILGLASIAVGAPSPAGMAIATGGQHIATQNLLKYSRTQEESADQAAMTALRKIQVSPKGLLTLLDKLGVDERIMGDEIDKYRQTHPLSSERISFIRNYLANNPNADFKSDAGIKNKHLRMIAKLKSFINEPDKTLAEYKGSTVPDYMARAVAYHRQGKLSEAIAEINAPLSAMPYDPYLNELKGQILFENGRVNESIISYDKALAAIPNSSIILLEVATAKIALEDTKSLKEAAKLLEKALVKEPEDPTAWHQLGIAYGKLGNLGKSYLALAEEAAIMNNNDQAHEYIALAEKNLAKDLPEGLRAKDLLEQLKKN
jgi:predicted Zn-dependent protease